MGRGVSAPASHGSGRAQLRHPALRRAGSLRVSVRDDRPRERVSLQQPAERFEAERSVARSPVEPLPPDLTYAVEEAVESARVSGDAVVPVVPSKLLHDCRALCTDRDMTVVATPLGHPAECTRQPPFGRLACDHPRALPRLRPVAREAQQVEATRLRTLSPLAQGRAEERHESSLFGMECEAGSPASCGTTARSDSSSRPRARPARSPARLRASRTPSRRSARAHRR